jgi:hypothetical protein
MNISDTPLFDEKYSEVARRVEAWPIAERV